MHDAENTGTTLWTKNFTILTIGSVISMLGNALTGFAFSLLVLDYTQSSFYYAVYIVIFTIPQMIMPVVSGAILDRFSRRRTIYTLDFLSAVLYFGAAVGLGMGYFSFGALAVCCFLIGSINSIYTVAYQSFYPLLISEGNYARAYSVSSILETFAALMIPVSAFLYNLVGIVPLLMANACCFFLAAVMETRIEIQETYIAMRQEEKGRETHVARFVMDIREGLRYLVAERGLLMIAVYFTFSALAGGASSVITLPYFKAAYQNGEYVYMMVWGMSMIGRSVGGAVLYRMKLPRHLKYRLALASYLTAAFVEGFYLYCGVPVMMAACFAVGLLGVTSYTIRTSSTQNYVPDEKKGRFNGVFNMLTTTGTFAGELLAGTLTLLLPVRVVLTLFCMVNAVAAIIFIGGHRQDVGKVYERIT